jgi:hypothetical protein
LSIYSLLIIGVFVAFAALRRSPTPSYLLLMIIGVAVVCTLDEKLFRYLSLERQRLD